MSSPCALKVHLILPSGFLFEHPYLLQYESLFAYVLFLYFNVWSIFDFHYKWLRDAIKYEIIIMHGLFNCCFCSFLLYMICLGKSVTIFSFSDGWILYFFLFFLFNFLLCGCSYMFQRGKDPPLQWVKKLPLRVKRLTTQSDKPGR